MAPARAEPLIKQVADHIRIWSGQKQVLADRLAGLRSGPVADVVDLHQDPTPPARWKHEAPLAEVESSIETLEDHISVDPWIPAHRGATLPPLDLARDETFMRAESQGARPDSLLGPFDALFELASDSNRPLSRPAGPLPPRTRFLVRVARVQKPSRSTKRNYDYFEELNAALAERAQRSAQAPGAHAAKPIADGWLPVTDPD